MRLDCCILQAVEHSACHMGASEVLPLFRAATTQNYFSYVEKYINPHESRLRVSITMTSQLRVCPLASLILALTSFLTICGTDYHDDPQIQEPIPIAATRIHIGSESIA